MDDFVDSFDELSAATDVTNDLADKLSLLVNDFDVDTASDADIDAKLSLMTVNIVDSLCKFPLYTNDYVDLLRVNPWLPTAFYWAFAVTSTRDMNPLSLARIGDQWHTAYNAILQSFEQVLEQLCHPGEHLDFDASDPTKSLCIQVVNYFGHLCGQLSVEKSSYPSYFTALITEAAEIAEDVMGFVGDQLHLPEDGVDIDSWIRSMLAMHLGGKIFPLDSHNRISEDDLEVLDDDSVGLSADVHKIKEQLLSTIEQLEIISITGMGGIGKTTLATRVYEDPEIVRHFHVRAWTSVSQKCQRRDVLLRLLQSIAPLHGEEISKESYEQLGELLCRRLRGRKFLVVVDDIWATEDWDDIRQWFPQNQNCSRIILTSRLTKVGFHANPVSHPHSMNCLSFEDSWRLFCKKVFLNQTCPPELVNFGLQIVEKCRGLPLAIIVVAGRLSKMSTTPECWENFANRVGSLVDQTQEQVLHVLSLSYNDLPQNLKACFLYMGTFPKNSEIPVQKLIRLWTAAGFLQEEKLNCVEEMAEKHLEDLVSRNLISVKRRTFDGRVKTCGVHDLLWDLSMIKARQEGHQIFGPCPVRHTNDDMEYLMILTNSYLYHDASLNAKSLLSSVGFKCLRILDILLQPLIHFPEEITDLVNLRCLALSTYGRIPRSVCKLGHLEILINDHRWACPVLPEEIWLLSCLRHLHVGTCAYVPDPSSLVVEGSCFSDILDLRTLSFINFSSCTKDVFLKVPKVKKLGIHEIRKEFLGDELLFNRLSNLVYLHELQELKLRCSMAKLEKPRSVPPWNSFVPNIKQLTLLETDLEWDEMNNLAMLPNLEVLKLKRDAFEGDICEQLQVFPQLKFLLLQSLSLSHWKANKDHFPNLQRLVIRDCISLMEIPNDFREIPELQSVYLDSYSYLTISSARNIEMEQVEMGNDEFNLGAGYISIEYRLMCLAVVFIYMNLRLKKQLGEQDRSCTKQKRNKRLLGKIFQAY